MDKQNAISIAVFALSAAALTIAGAPQAAWVALGALALATTAVAGRTRA